MAVIRKLVTSYSKELFLVCLQVIFAHRTNRFLLLFLLHSQYIVQGAASCSLPCIMNTSCHLRIDIVCICITETAESINLFPISQMTIEYEVKTLSFIFNSWFLNGDILGSWRGKIICSEGPSHTWKDIWHFWSLDTKCQ